jgi:teichuronic acid biosynthesis glycosyltransferase TuaC
MRIMFVTPGQAAGPQLAFVRSEAHALRNAGHHVELFTFDDGRNSPAYFISRAIELRAAIRAGRPDVVHAQLGKFNALLAACAAAGLAPLAITFRGTDVQRDTRHSALRCALGVGASQLAALFAAGIVCVSRGVRDKLWIRRRKRCLIVPMGVDLKAFVPGERDAARARLGFGADERIVLFNSGRNPAITDPELAGQAVEDARRRLGQLRLVVLDGSQAPEEIPQYMNAADCLLVTSHSAGRPSVVQEAMACNLPVVSVDACDMCEALSTVRNCAVVASCPIALGLAMADILRAPQRSDGRAHVSALGVDAIAARFAAFYEDLLGLTPRPLSEAL